MVVSRYGCALPVPHLLQTDQRLHLRRTGTSETAVGRVVCSLGTYPDGNVYGVGTGESCEGLWGIRFNTLFYEKTAGGMQEGVYFVNRDRRIAYWNDGAEQLSGYRARDVVGRCCGENFLGHVDADGRPLCKTGCPLTSVLRDGQARSAEFFLRHQQGKRVALSVRVFPMRDAAGNVIGAVEVFREANRSSPEKRLTELEHLVFRDTLTGLHNRRFLELRVGQAIAEHRRSGRSYGLLMFDLDRFKMVNDVHGHRVGDALLTAVGTSLTQGRRASDIVGRWGGEEFLVLMPDLNAVELGDIAERCRVLVGQSSVATESSPVSVTASIGATVLSHADTADLAIVRVDELMYQSKHSGGDRTTAG